MSAAAPRPARTKTPLVGRAFLSPALDFFVIGGALSIVCLALLAIARTQTGFRVPEAWNLPLVLMCTSSHFAASTVRLYTKPGAFQTLPAATMLFPAIAFAAAFAGLQWPELVGRNIYQLYLSWSPYHYAAQTFGLASMYAARAGAPFIGGTRRLVWWTCMLPFLHSFVNGVGAGLGWFLPPSFFIAHPSLLSARLVLIAGSGIAVFAAPVALLVLLRLRERVTVPWIVPCLLFTNGIWWAVLPYRQAFFWATIFHGLQYLAIVMAFHLKDHPPARPGQLAWLGPTLKFYAMCLALGYALFEILPHFFTTLGFSFSESVLVSVSVINIHHFVVDRGIWQLRKDPGNRRAVET